MKDENKRSGVQKLLKLNDSEFKNFEGSLEKIGKQRESATKAGKSFVKGIDSFGKPKKIKKTFKSEGLRF